MFFSGYNKRTSHTANIPIFVMCTQLKNVGGWSFQYKNKVHYKQGSRINGLVYIGGLQTVSERKSSLKASFLSLNFNKTYCLEFRTKNSVYTILDINYFNKTIVNIPYTKFVGVVIDDTLSFNNHIDHNFKIELCMLCNKVCNSNVVRESFKNAMCFLRAFCHMLRHNLFM